MKGITRDTLMLMDYDDRLFDTGIELSRLGEDVVSVFITVLSGDEIARVTFEDGHEEEFDSSEGRIISFYDGSYWLYQKGVINRLDKFLERGSSYCGMIEGE